MNHIYRVIWNSHLACWQAVSESAKGNRKSRTSASRRLKPLLAVATLAASMVTMAAPTGGVVVSGIASIGVSGNTTSINQGSSKAILNWDDFSIAKGETVNFVQPDANAIALNRVVTATPSSIQGALNANGLVFIVNPNGITFGSTAQVNVGGLVASTLAVTDDEFLAGVNHFTGDVYAEGSITQSGTIHVRDGGLMGLIAPQIQQAGKIVNNGGSILLAAASGIELQLDGRSLVNQQLHSGHSQAAIQQTAGLLRADGGTVILTSQGIGRAGTITIGANATIQAKTTTDTQRGRIELNADLDTGRIDLRGKLDASAVEGTSVGGIIKTSAAEIKVADTASVVTYKNNSIKADSNSYWELKAIGVRVASDGVMSGAVLGKSLNNGNVVLIEQGGVSGQGDIILEDAVSAASNTTLTLQALYNVIFNKDIVLTGEKAGLAIYDGTAVGHGDFYVNQLKPDVRVTLSGAQATFNKNDESYTVIHNIQQLQDINTNLAGRYVLGNDINATATRNWNNGKGFSPIGSIAGLTVDDVIAADNSTTFSGSLNGFGHRISNLYINRPASNFIGLIGTASNAFIQNINLANVSVSGNNQVGGLIGFNQTQRVYTILRNVNVTGAINANNDAGGVIGVNAGLKDGFNTLDSLSFAGNVSGRQNNIGGLIGINSAGSFNLSADSFQGVIDVINSRANASVRGNANVGGLVGLNTTFYGAARIDDSHSTGTVSAFTLQADAATGGLVGLNYARNGMASIYKSDSRSNVYGGDNTGGLVGKALSQQGFTLIDYSHADGEVSGLDYTGGLVGANIVSESVGTSFVLHTSATGAVRGKNRVGGLIGWNHTLGGNIETGNSSATGSVFGLRQVGGLVGLNDSEDYGFNNMNYNYATGAVTGFAQVAGLIGENYAGENGISLIKDNYATGQVIGLYETGGLIGRNKDIFNLPINGNVVSSYWNTSTSGQFTSAGGTGKTTAELKQIATFTGWDIADVSNTTSNSTWVIDQNNSTPWLR